MSSEPFFKRTTSWREDLNKSAACVCILGPDFYETNGPVILAESMRLGKPVMLIVPADRAIPIPPLFHSYTGQKVLINIPRYDSKVIVEKSMEQARRWGLSITGGYEHTWEDLPSPR